MGQDDYERDGAAPPGRPRPHYTYSRKSTFRRNKGAASGPDLTDNEDDNSNAKEVTSWFRRSPDSGRISINIERVLRVSVFVF